MADLWNIPTSTDTTRTAGSTSQPVTPDQVRPSTEGANRATDPLKYIVGIHESGLPEILTGERLSEVLASLNAPRAGRHTAILRTGRVDRFWQLVTPTGVQRKTISLYNDKQIVEKATGEGFKLSSPLEAGKALGYVHIYCRVDSDGKIIRGKDGKYIEATKAEYDAYRRPDPASDGATAQSNT